MVERRFQFLLTKALRMEGNDFMHEQLVERAQENLVA